LLITTPFYALLNFFGLAGALSPGKDGYALLRPLVLSGKSNHLDNLWAFPDVKGKEAFLIPFYKS
jgi:hypothetical protein